VLDLLLFESFDGLHFQVSEIFTILLDLLQLLDGYKQIRL